MPKAVLDTTVLVSAFLNPNPGGVSFELLRLARDGAYEFYVSDDILDEVAQTLKTHEHIRRRYRYPDSAIIEFCKELVHFANIVSHPSPVQIVRDPDDDMILACAIAAKASYLVTRDKDLLSIDGYAGVIILTPEAFAHIVRTPGSH